jgi:selenocysteine lyase/cysteine desulfurase
VANKAARVRYLRDRWVRAARDIGGVDILTPDDPELVGAITSFRLHGRGSREANQAVVRTLHDEFRLFTVARNGIARGDCVRVTPALYNRLADVDALVAALRIIAAR